MDNGDDAPDRVPLSARGAASPVQGLVCVHGYSNEAEHLLPVPGLFLSFDAVTAEAEVRLSDRLAHRPLPIVTSPQIDDSELERVRAFVDRATEMLHLRPIGSVSITHPMKAGAGLGSSAAVFAALTSALVALSPTPVSFNDAARVARLGSYSAAASLAGGLALIHPDGSVVAIDLPTSWDLSIVIFPIAPRAGYVGKRSQAIHLDVLTSPFYERWKTVAAAAAEAALEAVKRRDLTAFGQSVESYLLRNVAVVISGESQMFAWEGGTLTTFHLLRDFREAEGLDFYLSINTGPSVFAFGRHSVMSYLSDAVAGHELLPRPLSSSVAAQAIGISNGWYT